jgi:excisionase family DNA binding protein
MRLTPKQAAERAGVSLSLIYVWIGEKRLPHLRVGAQGKRGRILIEAEDLDQFLASLRVEGDGGDAEKLMHIR